MATCHVPPFKFFVFFRQIWARSRSYWTGPRPGVSSYALPPIDDGSGAVLFDRRKGCDTFDSARRTAILAIHG